MQWSRVQANDRFFFRCSGDNASYLEMMAAHQHAIAAAAAQQHAAIQQLPLHPAAAASSTSAAAAVAAAASSADLHGQSKRPRLDLIVAGSGNTYTLGSGAPGGSHPPPQPPPAATGSASTRHPVAALSTPLTIDTRESAVKVGQIACLSSFCDPIFCLITECCKRGDKMHAPAFPNTPSRMNVNADLFASVVMT